MTFRMLQFFLCYVMLCYVISILFLFFRLFLINVVLLGGGDESLFLQTYGAAQLFSTLIINVSCSSNQHIRMISEGSCDTEDWSNDAENSVFDQRNKLYFNTYSHRKQLF